MGHVYTSALKGYSATMPPAVAPLLEALPGVASAERDRAVSTTAQSTPTGVDRAEADLSPTAAVDGTHVADTIGALDDTAGIVGVAPGARIWPVKVLSSLGTGFNSDVICGIDYVTAHADEIEVANMSLGGAGTDDGACGQESGDAMHTAICSSVAAGVTYVVAATSTWMGGGYDTISGTSMASPHVAGGAALYAANNPGATPAQVQGALEGAGSLDWDGRDDPDGTKEPLLDVGGF